MSPPLRVLVADDELPMREHLRQVLTALGHQVVAVTDNGWQLVELCRSTSPDLVVSDVVMPDMDAIEAATLLSAERPVPFVLVSAYHDPLTLARAQTELVMAYLVKPVGPDDLNAAITVALARFAELQALKHEAADLQQALVDRKLIERAKGVLMNRLGVDENEAFRRLRKQGSVKNLKLAVVARKVLDAEEALAQFDTDRHA